MAQGDQNESHIAQAVAPPCCGSWHMIRPKQDSKRLAEIEALHGLQAIAVQGLHRSRVEHGAEA